MADEVELYSEMDDYLTNVTFAGEDEGFHFTPAFAAEIQNFADAINGKAECRNPAEDGVLMMKILDAVYASAESGHEVVL